MDAKLQKVKDKIYSHNWITENIFRVSDEIEWLIEQVEKQHKEIEELDESLHVSRVGRRDLVAYVKQLKEENELLSEHCAKLEEPIINKVLKRSSKQYAFTPINWDEE